MNKEIDSRISTREEQITQYTKDPHAILGLEKNAIISDIKKAYRTLSLQYHPDKWKGQNRHKELLQKQDLNKDEKSELEKLSVEYQARNLKFENIKEAYNTLDRDHYEKLRDEFFNAASGNDLEQTKKLLQENVDISTPFFIYDKLAILWHFAVLHAVSDSEWERFFKEKILTKLTPTDINSVSDISGNALYIACSRQNIDFAKTFIDRGAKFDGERNKDEIDTVITLLPYILDGRKDVLDINTKFSDPNSWLEDTVLSYAAANNLRDDKGTLIVQQLFDHYKNQISPETICSALTATDDNSLDSAKIILQNSHGLQKNHFNSILDTRFNAGQSESYSLILSHVAEQGYNDVINQQHSQITKEFNDCKSFGDDQGVEKCKRFLGVIENQRTISSPEPLKEGFVAERVKLFEGKDTQEQNSERKVIREIKEGSVADKMKLFENRGKQEQKSKHIGIREITKGLVADKMKLFGNTGKKEQKSEYKGIREITKGLVADKVKLFGNTGKQEQKSEHKGIREITKGSVADKMKLFENTGKQEQKSKHIGISGIQKGLVERTAKFLAKDNQKSDQKSDIREQPTTKVKDMVSKLEKSKSSNPEKSYDGKKEADKALSHVSVSKLIQNLEKR